MINDDCVLFCNSKREIPHAKITAFPYNFQTPEKAEDDFNVLRHLSSKIEIKQGNTNTNMTQHK